MIDIEKFICSLIEKTSGFNTHVYHCDLLNALKEQGLEYKDGEIVKTQRRIAAEAKEAIFDDDGERIRKRIIDALHGDVLDMEETNKAIAWLEKQGSQQPTIIWHSVSEEPEEMKELFCEWESDDATWHDVAFYDEESKTFRHAKMPINVTKWVYVDELLERQGEQKPAVVDFKAKNWYVSKVDGKIHDLTYNPTDKKELKKLTQSVTKTSEQVWSEEDQCKVNWLLHLITSNSDIDDSNTTECEQWLKSLKDRLKGE